ncbi:hypothetical protein RJ55_03411 [Drechmeria coniospora]|nr:hypothetical protein RJ55_03411 [Drechmeria coniospora]
MAPFHHQLSAALCHLFCSLTADEGRNGRGRGEKQIEQQIEQQTEQQTEQQKEQPTLGGSHSQTTPRRSGWKRFLFTQTRTMEPKADGDKMNVSPDSTHLATTFGGLDLAGPDDGTLSSKPKQDAPDDDPEAIRVREQNQFFITEAIAMARLALRTNETPVGCVLVHDGRIIAKGMNATNVTRNGTRHAELMAISALLSVAAKSGPKTTALKPKPAAEEATASNRPSTAEGTPPATSSSAASGTTGENGSVASVDLAPPDDGNDDGSKGHLYPYGQRFYPAERVDPAILKECILYVTVEPCVMCASLLRQFGIKKVYFGAVNDKFGGTGGVFSIHANSLPVSPDGQTAAAHPIPRQPQAQLPDGTVVLGTSYPPDGGDGGNVEPGFEIEGGWGRDEAVGLLRRFYVQENGRAPVPRKKEGRAARLAALMEKDGNGSTTTPGADAAGDEDLADDADAAPGEEANSKEHAGLLDGNDDFADDDNYLDLIGGRDPPR